MNSWGNEQYGMPNMMGMGGMMPNMMPGMAPHLAPPYMMGDMNQMGPGMNHMAPQMNQMAPPMNQIGPQVNQMGHPMNMPVNNPQPVAIVGPVQPDSMVAEGQEVPPINPEVEAEGQITEEIMQTDKTDTPDKQKQLNRERNDRRDRDRERDRRHPVRSRSRNREKERDHMKDHGGRNDRGNRNRDHRERQSKWDNNDKLNQPLNPPSVMMASHPQQMMYGNMMPNHMMPQQMEMGNMQQQMMHVPPGMNMMPNMMMMNQQPAMMANQPIFFITGVLLPPTPGIPIPPRRERPPGCRTIFVGGLPQGITEDVLTEIFQRFGDIEEVKLHKGVCHIRFEKQISVEQSFSLSGWRLKGHNQSDNEAIMLFIDYALNREDQNEYEKNKRRREPTPPRVEPYNPTTFAAISEKIKSDTEFAEAAPTLVAWLERGECNKKNANPFYSLIQASNNQLQRLFNEKMQIDEEYQTLKNTMRDKFAHILLQFEQVAKILKAAKHQRVSDHFSKQQRRNIEMCLKMTEELENIKEEFQAAFNEDEMEKPSKAVVPLEKYEQLQAENENLTYELEGYKNEAHLAKEEAERKFEKFKAHFIAQQALQNKQAYPPLPSPPMPKIDFRSEPKPKPPPPLPEDFNPPPPSAPVPVSDAKLISMLSAFLMVHPKGASLDYLFSYAKSMVPNATQAVVHDILNKYSDVFCRKTTGVGACIEHRWSFMFFDSVKLQ